MAALGACVSWIWSSWELNALTDVLETCVLQMALSNSPTFHGPYSLQVLRASWEVQVVELSWSRDVLDAGHQSTPQDLCWTWKLWSPPSLRSICVHRIFFIIITSWWFLMKDISREESQPAMAQGASLHSSFVSGAPLHLPAENQP